MARISYFAAGFMSGWLVRSTVDSSRSFAVRLVAKCYQAVDQVRKITALEREYFEDLVAEARAQAETTGNKGKSTEPVRPGVSRPPDSAHGQRYDA